MPDYYDLKTTEERRAWMQAENARRCELATARKASNPAATLDDLEFAVVLAEKPEAADADWEMEFNPTAV